MVVLSRHADADTDKAAFENSVLHQLGERTSVLVAPHIYHIAEGDAVWGELRRSEVPLLILSWLYPRPAEWLLRRHGIGEDGMVVLDLGVFDTPEQCLDACVPHLPANSKPSCVRELWAATSDRWYPIVDYSRCVNCKQCLQFCLFGVYELDGGGKVKVTKPDYCKPGCPACSRICPRGAIMFPLYEKDPAIAGAPGLFPSPDDTARRAFERRTKLPYRKVVDTDLDALVDELDRLAGGRP